MKQKLIEAGFSDYQARAYLAMLHQDMLTAAEISNTSGLPQGKIYSVIKSLEEQGFCTVFPGSVKRYKMVPPEKAFAMLRRRREEELGKIDELTKALQNQYENRSENGQTLDFIEILSSKTAQIQRFDDIMKASTKTLYSFNKRPYATGFMRDMAEIKRASAPLRKIIKEGTEVRAIFEAEEEYTVEFIRMVQYYESIGEHVRIHPGLPLKMLLADGEKAMVSLKSLSVQNFNLISLVVDHTDLAKGMMDLFEVKWEESLTIEQFLKTVKKNSTKP